MESIIVQDSPLRWPDGWTRTRIADQKPQHAWKKTWPQVLTGLEKELRKLGVTTALVTVDGGHMPRDPGVAVHFSRKPQEDHSWQEVLGIEDPLPTIAQIDEAFKRLAIKHHPDRIANGSGGDPKLWEHYSRNRQLAKDWVLGTHKQTHDFVIACDRFKEPRWNLNAIKMTITAIRQIERYGTSSLMERAFKGFAAALTAQASKSSEGAA